MNSTSNNAILQLLKQAASDIDSSQFPITATFIQRLEALSEQYPNEGRDHQLRSIGPIADNNDWCA